MNIALKTDSYEEFKQLLDDRGGFISAHWDGILPRRTID